MLPRFTDIYHDASTNPGLLGSLSKDLVKDSVAYVSFGVVARENKVSASSRDMVLWAA
ncbi:MAG: hypothetical protein ACE5IB_06950 [Candidatus Geothermarchaeales archaeon]